MSEVRYQIEPMPAWPHDSGTPRRSPFRASWSDTLELLGRELDHLGVRGAVAIRVVATDADVRRDGMLRANARVRHHGVILSFESKHGPLTYPCASYPDWQANLRAIALALQALRAVDRYGVTVRGEQYAGWRAIEAGPTAVFPTKADARDWLLRFTGVLTSTPDQSLLRLAARRAHPDVGGTQADWECYLAAKARLNQEE